jgi:hypothetical protein
MRDLEPTLADLAAATDRFVAAAAALPADRWDRAAAPGKWSPAQVSEHVALGAEVATDALRERSALPPIPRFLRPLIRFLFLRRVLKSGRFPRGKAPAAFLPSQSPGPREVVLARVRASADRFAAECRTLASAGTTRFVHPVFGALSVADYARLTALHADHHRPQLSREADSASDAPPTGR